MPVRLRHLLDRAGLPWTDIALAAILIVAGVFWVAKTGQQDAPGPVFMHLGPPTKDDVLAEHFIVQNEDRQWPGVLVNVIAGGAVAVRRRLPFTAFVVAIGAIFLIQDGLAWPGFLAILICAYSAVAYGRSVLGASILLLAAAVTAASMFSRTIPDMPGWLGPFVVLLPAGLSAAALRHARERADTAARRAAALEREQAAAADAAIAEERARIARELHDVVSHHVSVMVVQAGAAGKVIDQRPDLARGALTAIETSGRTAMAELRHLLGLMAPADDRLHPQPGLADLDTLVDAVRAAGQPVTVHHVQRELPPGVDLTAYRVVQEGLTNALRYAPGAATTVDIRDDAEDLVVEVGNAAASGFHGSAGAGRGLIGLRERLRLLDGTLETRDSLGGGFRLTARIPAALEQSAPAALSPSPAPPGAGESTGQAARS